MLDLYFISDAVFSLLFQLNIGYRSLTFILNILYIKVLRDETFKEGRVLEFLSNPTLRCHTLVWCCIFPPYVTVWSIRAHYSFMLWLVSEAGAAYNWCQGWGGEDGWMVWFSITRGGSDGSVTGILPRRSLFWFLPKLKTEPVLRLDGCSKGGVHGKDGRLVTSE